MIVWLEYAISSALVLHFVSVKMHDVFMLLYSSIESPRSSVKIRGSQWTFHLLGTDFALQHTSASLGYHQEAAIFSSLGC